MGAIEDTRKLLQDLVSPDLKSLIARVDALEKKMDSGFTDLKQMIKENDLRAEQRHTALVTTLHLQDRISRLEQSLTVGKDCGGGCEDSSSEQVTRSG